MDSSRFRLVVTSGPTREWIDPVRFISNPATGQTGWQIAKAGISLGFKEVVLISGASRFPFQFLEGARNISTDTTEDMANAVFQESREQTILVMAAAPADFTPVEVRNTKTKKTESDTGIQLQLKPTTDILMACRGFDFPQYYRIGFAAETDNVKEYAREKLKRKELDFICANEVFRDNQGFAAGENALLVLGKDGSEKHIGPVSKDKLARELLIYLIGKF